MGMFYTFRCPVCGNVQEDYQDIHVEHALVCSECDMNMDRYWQADLPIIQGETVAGGHDVSGYDPMLGMHIRDRAHLNKVMEKKDLQFYEAPSYEAECSRELNYLSRHKAPGDSKEVTGTIEKAHKAGAKKRRSIQASKRRAEGKTVGIRQHAEKVLRKSEI